MPNIGGIVWVIRDVVDIQDILHRGYERGAAIGWNFPVFAEMRLNLGLHQPLSTDDLPVTYLFKTWVSNRGMYESLC